MCQRVGVRCLAIGQCAVDFGIADTQAVIDFALMQTGEHQLVTQLISKSGDTGTFGLQAFMKLTHVHLILCRHIALCLVYGGSIDAYSCFTRKLQLRAITDHALKHCASKFRRGRQGQALLRPLLGDLLDLKC